MNDLSFFFLNIGSLGNQADYLTQELPKGKAFICKNTEDLPKILQKILIQAMEEK